MTTGKKLQGLILRCFECDERLGIEYSDTDPTVMIKYHFCKTRMSNQTKGYINAVRSKPMGSEEKPDAYLAQDLENRFEGLVFLRDGIELNYQRFAIPIERITWIGPIWSYTDPGKGGYFEVGFDFDYGGENKVTAASGLYEDMKKIRNDLLKQVNDYRVP